MTAMMSSNSLAVRTATGIKEVVEHAGIRTGTSSF
jgi:hypothetical protein